MGHWDGPQLQQTLQSSGSAWEGYKRTREGMMCAAFSRGPAAQPSQPALAALGALGALAAVGLEHWELQGLRKTTSCCDDAFSGVHWEPGDLSEFLRLSCFSWSFARPVQKLLGWAAW